MDEAEALSTKCGILKNQEFVVYEALNDVKKKYGKGFELELKIRD